MKKGTKNTGKKFHSCETCNRVFNFKDNPDQFLCYKHRPLPCKICGKDLPQYRRKPKTKTCSTECQQEANRVKAVNFQRNRIKTGNSVDEVGDIFFGNVKEPLMPVPKGNHGYLGVLTYNKTKDKIQCHICGLFFKSLSGSGHLKLHGLDNEEYKEKFSLDRTMALVSESTRVKHLNALLNRDDYATLQSELKKYRETDEHKQKSKTTNKDKKRRIYAKNKTGTCPLQLLDRVKVLQEKLGFIPNSEDFKREYKGKYIGSIQQIYGSYNKALEYMGITPRDQFEPTYSQDELIKFIKDFYMRFDRSPCNTDFKRGYLPSAHTYYRRFKSLNHARALAGVPLIISLGGYKWRQIPLTKELKKQFA